MTYEGDDNRTTWFANWHSDEMYQFVRSETLHVEQTDYQRLEVIETEIYGRILVLNGEVQIATNSDATVHEAMCHPAMVTHDNPKDVLIIGGGDGGSTREVLKHNPDHIDLVEIDQRVIEVCKEYFPRFAQDLDNEKVEIHTEDGRKFLNDTNKMYDVVIMDISDPQGPAKTVFTTEFYDSVTNHMNRKGVLHTHCESPDSSGDVFYRTLATLEQHFENIDPYRHWVPAYIDFWGRAVASDHYSPKQLSIPELQTRFENRAVELNWLTPELCHAMFRSLNKRVKEKMKSEWEPYTEDDVPDFERP